MLDPNSLREFYTHLYPVELITQWLTYNGTPMAVGATSGQEAKEEGQDGNEAGERGGAAVDMSAETAEDLRTAAAVAEGHLARREFCFTLLGDIFTRFRSYRSSAELRGELIRCFPEKIDVGAVYNIRPNQKQGLANVFPVERELIFDIDMSDYDNVRSCCNGKSICVNCWPWMACAAHVLRTIVTEDFGFQYILPVFSGRRGIHLWVCDKRARVMHDDERGALVGYLTVVAPKTMRSSIVADLANHRPIHPTIRHVLRAHMDSAFTNLFITSASDNPNNVQYSPKAAFVVYDATLAVLKMGRRDALNRFLNHINFENGNVLDWAAYLRGLGSEMEATDVLHAVQLLLMYPRLDEHVSTRRDHLLKLPFCVHPGTSSLCCPLEWEDVDTFDPSNDAPKLADMLLTHHLDEKWTLPLRRMLKEMQADAGES